MVGSAAAAFFINYSIFFKMQNQKREDSNASIDAKEPIHLNETEQKYLSARIKSLQTEFSARPHPLQAEYMALKIWELDDDYGIAMTLKLSMDYMLKLARLMTLEENSDFRLDLYEVMEHTSRYTNMFFQILDNPCLSSYSR
jgi:hypothetical protein